jgi:hypothetical protein
METAIIGLGVGAVSGMLSGFFVSGLSRGHEILCRARQRHHYGRPLLTPPCRCRQPGKVRRAIYWAAAGMYFGIAWALVSGSEPLWVALGVALLMLAFLALCLLFLVLDALYTWFVLHRPALAQLARETLVGKEATEAVSIAQKKRWRYEVVAGKREWWLTGIDPYGLPHVQISVQDGKVTEVDVV